ncbi:MAG: thioredoxin domain-containing protein [Actinobacteria bacterium]|nr:thioredoxin domain-containing protein [Actinomycetota bacterium]
MEEHSKEGSDGKSLDRDFRFSPRPNLAHEIAWMPWGEEAFHRAEREGKAVLLSISAVWCHWCHVMDETSYSDRAVIDLVNSRFVPVRVDSDRNPDINRRYNQGGWPTTAFLDPHGTLLAGATYIPPEAMRAALERISELYAQHDIDVTTQEEAWFPAPETGVLDLGIVEESGAQLLRAWDRAFGGLGREPKFPQVEALSLALELYADEGDAEYLVFARTSLEAMIGGNLLDDVEGGFFRYSTTRDWSIPHYEKMLADNAGLINVLLKAYSLSGAEIFRRTAGETADYIYRVLSDGDSRFFGSQDADEEYYLLKAGDRKKLPAPPVDRTVYTDLAARAAASLLVEGTTLQHDEHSTLALSALEFLWSESFRPGEGMAHYHDGKPHRWGLLDDGVEAAIAFLTAFGFTGERRYLERAEAMLALLITHHWDESRSMLMDTSPHHLPPGLKPQPADLGSQSRAAEAMILYWSYGGDEKWRHRAVEVLSAVSGLAAAYGIMAAPFAKAVNLYLRGPIMVKISGDPGGSARSPLRLAALSPQPRILPMVSGKVGIMEEAWSEVCTMESCRLRTADPEVLARDLGVLEKIAKGVDHEGSQPG